MLVCIFPPPYRSASRYRSCISKGLYSGPPLVTKEERTLAYLKQVVNRIYSALLRTEYLTCETYSQIKPFLPREIHFIHSEELLQMYPNLSPKEREDEICKKYGAVFIIGIGGKLSCTEIR